MGRDTFLVIFRQRVVGSGANIFDRQSKSWRRIDLRSEDRIPDSGHSLVVEAEVSEGELAFMNTT
jgi:hypothetical protein